MQLRKHFRKQARAHCKPEVSPFTHRPFLRLLDKKFYVYRGQVIRIAQ